MLNALTSAFNIRPGEGRLMACLLAQSFCIGLARLFMQTAAGTLFLIVFGVRLLPYVYISVAVVVPLIGLVYERLGRRLALPRLLLINVGGQLLVTGALWLNLTLTGARWPAFALAVWYEVVWVMTSLCLWSLAGSLLNVRQGKRLFGLISAGDVVAATLGGLLTPALVDWFGTANLLIGAMAGLAGAAVLVRYISRAFACALVGLGLLSFGALQLSYILLVFLLACIALIVVLGREYVRMVMQALARRWLGGGALRLLDSDSVALVLASLNSPHPGAAIYALDTLESIEHPALAEGLRRALVHPMPEVRRETLVRIERLNLTAALGEVRACAATEPDPSVRGAAVRALAALDEGAFDEVAALLDLPDPPVRLGAVVGLIRSGGLAGVLAAGERLNRLAHSPDPADRALAAQALGEIGVQSYYQPLMSLLDDVDLIVRRAAVEAAGKLKNPRLTPRLLAALAAPDIHRQAATALAAYGEPVVPALRAASAQPGLTRALTIRLIRVAGRIRGRW